MCQCMEICANYVCKCDVSAMSKIVCTDVTGEGYKSSWEDDLVWVKRDYLTLFDKEETDTVRVHECVMVYAAVFRAITGEVAIMNATWNANARYKSVKSSKRGNVKKNKIKQNKNKIIIIINNNNNNNNYSILSNYNNNYSILSKRGKALEPE